MIQLETVPEYLRKGELYNIFLENDDDSLIPISKQYYKEDTSIDTIDDLYHLFHTLRYWMIEENDYPYKNIFDFVRNNKDLDYNSFYEIFIDVQFIKQIKMLMEYDNISSYTTTEDRYLLLLKYAYDNGYSLGKETLMYTIRNAYFKCIQYLCKNNRTSGTENRQLECLRYLYNLYKHNYSCNECPLHEDINVENNKYNIDCVKYTFEQL